jgi:hypothetical protein
MTLRMPPPVAATPAAAGPAPKILAMWTTEGLTLRAIAARLNAAEPGAAGDATEEATPVASTWSPMRVRRVSNRAGWLTAWPIA